MEKRLFVPQELIPALLDGTKTMHRVVLKPQPNEKHSYCHGVCTSSTDNKNVGRVGFGASDVLVKEFIKLPYQVGNLLWVPEIWRDDNKNYIYEYRADIRDDEKSPWHSPVTMPREAARIWLEVVSAKVERLWSITEEDARAEGIIDGGCINCGEHEPCGCDNPQPDARDGYIWIWNAHAKPGHGWDDNPWCEIIEFRRVER